MIHQAFTTCSLDRTNYALDWMLACPFAKCAMKRQRDSGYCAEKWYFIIFHNPPACAVARRGSWVVRCVCVLHVHETCWIQEHVKTPYAYACFWVLTLSIPRGKRVESRNSKKRRTRVHDFECGCSTCIPPPTIDPPQCGAV